MNQKLTATKKQLAEALKMRDALQKKYDALHVASTQNVRGPLSYAKMVMSVLVKRYDDNVSFEAVRTINVVVNGKTHTMPDPSGATIKVFAKDMENIGEEFSDQYDMSYKCVMNKLESRGFTNLKKTSVSLALSQLRARGIIRCSGTFERYAIADDKDPNAYKGRPVNLYYIPITK